MIRRRSSGSSSTGWRRFARFALALGLSTQQRFESARRLYTNGTRLSEVLLTRNSRGGTDGETLAGGDRERAVQRRVGVGQAERLARLAVAPVLVVIAARTLLEFALAGRYGWQRDELYYAVAGRHLQGGYVEFPPVTALLSAVARVLFGWSLTGFRLFAILAGAGTTLLAALVARELGGTRRAQILAAVLVGLAPILIITNGLFQPVSFDQLTTMALLWLALRLALGRGSWPRSVRLSGSDSRPSTRSRVVLVLLLAGFLAWRRDALSVRPRSSPPRSRWCCSFRTSSGKRLTAG